MDEIMSVAATAAADEPVRFGRRKGDHYTAKVASAMRLPSRLWYRAIAALILVVGSALSIFAAYEARQSDMERVRSVLELQTEYQVRNFQSKLADAGVPVEALATFTGTQRVLDPEEFYEFAVAARGDNPLVRLSWAPLVSGPNRMAFEAGALDLGYPAYGIRERDQRNLLVPAGERAEYAPVLFEDLFEPSISGPGFDLLSDPERRAALEIARDQGQPVASLLVVPRSEGDSSIPPPSLLLGWPVYRGGIVPKSPDERRAAFLGFVDGQYDFAELMSFVFTDTRPPTATVSIFMGSLGSVSAQPDIAYHADTGKITGGAGPVGAPPAKGIRQTRYLQQFGQEWTFIFDYPEAIVAPLRNDSYEEIFLLGMTVTLLGTAYAWIEGRRRTQVERLVVERTHEVRDTTERLTAMIEASPHAIVALDNNCNVTGWNRAAEAYFGYEAEEVLGKPYPLVLPDEAAEFADRFRRVTQGTVLRNIESHRLRKDGTVMETLSSAAAFRDAAGEVQGAMFIIEDATERNRAQRQLRAAQRMDAIGQLTGGMAHDFNNILGIIIGNLDFLAESLPSPSAERELAGQATQAALRGAELTRQLLAFARRQPLAPKLIHMPAALESTTRLLRRTLGENVILELRSPADTWEVLVDLAQLEAAIVNLAVNARDAMPEGGKLAIETSNVILDGGAAELNPEAAPGHYVCIAVSDNGAGMPPDVAARVFEPFFTTKGSKGTGLGLSMVHGFVKQSGGHSKVYSEVGKGTTIKIYLPRASEKREAEETEDTVSAKPLRGHEVILVVEDNRGMRDVAIRQLQSLGYRAIPANDGVQALDILKAGAPVDLLFTDMVMPGGLDGKALWDEASSIRPGLKVLFTSGFTEMAASAAMDDSFTANLLSKPYRKEQLAGRIRAALDAVD